MVNNYIKEATGGDFTAKDFRTWAGTLNTIRALKAMGEAVTETDCKKNILAALDEVSSKLGIPVLFVKSTTCTRASFAYTRKRAWANTLRNWMPLKRRMILQDWHLMKEY
jgi:DNA topoisomerase IB